MEKKKKETTSIADIKALLDTSNTRNWYGDQLKKPEWQRKRLEVFQRDEWTCTYCGDKTEELHVHHLEYRGKPWEAEINKLRTACCDCHKMISHFDFTDVVSVFKPEYLDKRFLFFCVKHEDKAVSVISHFKSSQKWDVIGFGSSQRLLNDTIEYLHGRK